MASLLELLLNEFDLVALSIFRRIGSFLLPTCFDVGSSEDDRLSRFPPPMPLLTDDVTETESLYEKKIFTSTFSQNKT